MTNLELRKVCDYKINNTACDVFFEIEKCVRASVLNNHKDKRGNYSFASRLTIAEKIGKSERTVERAIKQLVAAGLIFVKRTTDNAHTYLTEFGRNVRYIFEQNVRCNNSSINLKDNNSLSIASNSETTNVSDDLNSAAATNKEKAAEQRKQAKILKDKKRKAKEDRKNEIKTEFKALLKCRESDFPEYAIIDDDAHFESLKGLVDILADVLCDNEKTIFVGKDRVSVTKYINEIRKLTRETATDVIERVRNAKNIIHPQSYLLTSIYNACKENTLFSY